ncbi:MAG: phage tail assembly chaperone G [Lachnotalea sp.]
MKICINEKEYESGNITREKYRKFREVFEGLLGKDKDKQTFTDEDLDNMLDVIVAVYENQFSIDEANEALDEVPDILLNFSLINAEVLNKLNIQAEDMAKNLNTNKININGITYESGKIGRKKYSKFRKVYDETVKPEKQTYTDEDLDRMLEAIVIVYDEQFTLEEANKSLNDVSEIIFKFAMINANIIKKLSEQAEDVKKNLSSRK